jgi:hypothetical protein
VCRKCSRVLLMRSAEMGSGSGPAIEVEVGETEAGREEEINMRSANRLPR